MIRDLDIFLHLMVLKEEISIQKNWLNFVPRKQSLQPQYWTQT